MRVEIHHKPSTAHLDRYDRDGDWYEEKVKGASVTVLVDGEQVFENVQIIPPEGTGPDCWLGEGLAHYDFKDLDGEVLEALSDIACGYREQSPVIVFNSAH